MAMLDSLQITGQRSCRQQQQQQQKKCYELKTEVQDSVKPPAPDCLCSGNDSASLVLGLKCPAWGRGPALEPGRGAKEPGRVAG